MYPWKPTRASKGKLLGDFKNEEYIADFCLVSRRTLSDRENTIFKYHYLLGADWKLCCRKLNIDRGTFFHEIIESSRSLGEHSANSSHTLCSRLTNTSTALGDRRLPPFLLSGSKLNR